MNATAARRIPRRNTVYVSLSLATLGLLVAQLSLGTSLYFAMCVALSLLTVILTVRSIGIATVGGILIAYCAFRYVGFSQVLKVFLGEPGELGLPDADTTVTVVLVGMLGMCAAAFLVSHLLGRRVLIKLDASPKVLRVAALIAFGIGLAAQLTVRALAVSETGDLAQGGLVGIARQLTPLAEVGLVVEIWRALVLTKGKRSLSPVGMAMLLSMMALGFLANSKGGTAEPFVAYLVTSLAYRGRISVPQLTAAVSGFLIFVLFLYPLIHVLRGQSSFSGISGDVAIESLERYVTDPERLAEEWSHVEGEDDEAPDLYALGPEEYTGFSDPLLSRFTLIAFTGTVVASVDEYGPIGWRLVTSGLEYMVPTLIDPDKPRLNMNHYLTWYYGVIPWGVETQPTIGIFGDSYAVDGMSTAVYLPFIFMGLVLLELQLTGTRIGGNFMAVIMTLSTFHAFGEADSQQFVVMILRAIPQQLLFIVVIFLAAGYLTTTRGAWSRTGPKRRIPPPGAAASRSIRA